VSDKLIEQTQYALEATYALYIKTQCYHWNVTGPQFKPLHELFEQQYGALALAIDDIAEKIRHRQVWVPLSAKLIAAATTNIEEAKVNAKAIDMVAHLEHDHNQLAALCQQLIELSNQENDTVLEDFFIARKSFHEEAAWFLRSSK